MIGNYSILLIMFLIGLLIVSLLLMIYLFVKLLKRDENSSLFSIGILGIVISFLISATLGIIQDIF